MRWTTRLNRFASVSPIIKGIRDKVNAVGGLAVRPMEAMAPHTTSHPDLTDTRIQYDNDGKEIQTKKQARETRYRMQENENRSISPLKRRPFSSKTGKRGRPPWN